MNDFARGGPPVVAADEESVSERPQVPPLRMSLLDNGLRKAWWQCSGQDPRIPGLQLILQLFVRRRRIDLITSCNAVASAGFATPRLPNPSERSDSPVPRRETQGPNACTVSV